MKYILLLPLLMLYSCDGMYPKKETVLHEAENVAVPDELRHVVGYDSVEMIIWKGKWQANFCFPNKWVLNKFKLDTAK